MKKTLSSVLAFIMLLSVFAFAGCSSDEPKKTEKAEKTNESLTDTAGTEKNTSAEPVTAADGYVKDLNGHEFFFAVRANNSAHLSTHEVFADVVTGDRINDAVFARNAALQRDFNCTVNEDKTASSPIVEYRDALLTGEYITDFFFDTVSNTKSIMTDFFMANLLSLENLQLEKNWYDSEAVKGFTVDERLFCVAGDAATMDDRACWIMYFNKDMINAAMKESTSGRFDAYKNDAENGFYKFIIDGKWTADAMYEIMVSAKNDTDGNGKFDITKDVVGYIGEAANNLFHVLAGGAMISGRDPNGDIVIPDKLSDEVLNAWKALKPVLTSKYRYVGDTGSAFRNGHSAFFGCNLASVLNSSSVFNVDFGIAPLPKTNAEEMNYYAVPSSSLYCVYSIPRTASFADDAVQNGFSDGCEQAAFFLDKMGEYSVDTLTVAFYDAILAKHKTQSGEAGTVLKLALEHKSIDPAVLLSFGTIRTWFQEAGSPSGAGAFGSASAYDTLSSKYSQKAETVKTAYKNWRNKIAGNSEN